MQDGKACPPPSLLFNTLGIFSFLFFVSVQVFVQEDAFLSNSKEKHVLFYLLFICLQAKICSRRVQSQVGIAPLHSKLVLQSSMQLLLHQLLNLARKDISVHLAYFRQRALQITDARLQEKEKAFKYHSLCLIENSIYKPTLLYGVVLLVTKSTSINKRHKSFIGLMLINTCHEEQIAHHPQNEKHQSQCSLPWN